MPFSQATLDFLFQNRMNDSKQWFSEHRSEYNELVLRPTFELVSALEPAIHAIDPLLICEPKVSRSVSRIFRDTRFSRDKSVFRDVMWASFDRKRDMIRHPLPGFFFEISPGGYRYGCGWYAAGRDVMELLRERVVSRDARFLRAHRAFKSQNIFVMEGDEYKKPRYVDEPEEYREWLQKKNICFICNGRDRELLFSDKLAKVLAHDLPLLKPEYEFMLSCESDVTGAY